MEKWRSRDRPVCRWSAGLWEVVRRPADWRRDAPYLQNATDPIGPSETGKKSTPICIYYVICRLICLVHETRIAVIVSARGTLFSPVVIEINYIDVHAAEKRTKATIKFYNNNIITAALALSRDW